MTWLEVLFISIFIKDDPVMDKTDEELFPVI